MKGGEDGSGEKRVSKEKADANERQDEAVEKGNAEAKEESLNEESEEKGIRTRWWMWMRGL